MILVIRSLLVPHTDRHGPPRPGHPWTPPLGFAWVDPLRWIPG